MNHSPLTPSTPLFPELAAELARVRAARAFNPATYLAAKVQLIAGYLKTHSLRGAVLGLSGGVDSAVVLGILREVQRVHPETLQQVRPLILSTELCAIGQHDAAKRARALCDHWGVRCGSADLYETALLLSDRIESAMGVSADSWALGQLTSYIRTPALYYATSLFTSRGCPAIVVGTTNRDEGAYLGYVGKAADGMVDLQVIADLHKSEVYTLARFLGVTQEIIDAVPSGEMHDGRVDEQVFGAPYDFVELYLARLCGHTLDLERWSEETHQQWERLAENLEGLHAFNAHKYLVGSPAVHLNVLESAVPGGWKA